MNNFKDQLDLIVKKYQNIEKKLSNQENLDQEKRINLNKEYSELTPVVEKINHFNLIKQEIYDLNL